MWSILTGSGRLLSHFRYLIMQRSDGGMVKLTHCPQVHARAARIAFTFQHI